MTLAPFRPLGRSTRCRTPMNTVPPSAPSARSRLAAPTAAVRLLAADCCSGAGADDGTASHSAGAGSGRTRTALVTRGDGGGAFWDLVREGAEAAADDGDDLTYTGDAGSAGRAG
ncbi:hypothetical protein NGM37_28860, partial [Streptomyces sp. TRM76130]|nr:hypothetical protein [Streptomyces sp. TRM76130]